jgi:hypothetical protein
VVNLTRIYTRGGDDGDTSLGDGRRVSKASLRITAYGTVDELNAQLGVVRTLALPPDWDGWLQRIQNELFDLGADLAVPEEERPDRSSARSRTRLRVEAGQVAWLEARCDEVNESLEPLTSFILLMLAGRRVMPGALPPEYQAEQGQTKQLPPILRRQAVFYPTKEPAGTIIIDTPNTYLYLVLGNGKAMRYGIGYRYSSLRRLVDIIGVPATKDMLLGGLQFDAEEALKKHLVWRSVPEAEFDAWIEKTVKGISEGAPLTGHQIKFTLNEICKDPADRDTAKTHRLHPLLELLDGKLWKLKRDGGKRGESVRVGGAELRHAFVLDPDDLGRQVAIDVVPVGIDAQDGHVDALGVHVRHSCGERLSLERVRRLPVHGPFQQVSGLRHQTVRVDVDRPDPASLDHQRRPLGRARCLGG